MKRETLMRSASAALIALTLSGCGKSDTTPTPEPTPILVPTQEIYTGYNTDLFDTANYQPDVINYARKLWLEGCEPNALQPISLLNGNSLLITCAPATQQPVDFKSASTIIGTDVVELPDGHYMKLAIQGNLDPTAHNEFPQNTQHILKEVDISHETVVFLSQMYFLTSGAQDIGFDFSKSFQEQGIPVPPTQEFIDSYREMRSNSNAYSEAIAELADFYLMKDSIDKNEDGSIRFSVIEGQNAKGETVVHPVPTFQGVPYLDSGLFYMVSTTIAPSIHQYVSFDDLMGAYTNLTDIPGFEQYLSQISEHFSQ